MHVPSDIKFQAADHCMHIKANLTPTVMYDIDCPENLNNKLGNFYQGNVKVMLKESVVDPSSDFQCASEFIVNNGLMNDTFLMLQGDGRFDYD